MIPDKHLGALIAAYLPSDAFGFQTGVINQSFTRYRDWDESQTVAFNQGLAQDHANATGRSDYAPPECFDPQLARDCLSFRFGLESVAAVSF